jgi:hypothetical protein
MAMLLLFLAGASVEVGGYLEEEERSFGRQRKRPSLFDYERGGVSVQRCKRCVSDINFLFLGSGSLLSLVGRHGKRSTDSWLIPSEVTEVCFLFKLFNILLAFVL